MHENPKQVTAQSVVRVGISLRDVCGEVLQIDIDQLEVVVGYGQLLPKIEQALLGLCVGERRLLPLQPEEAFGSYDESRVVEFDRQEFPDVVAAGDMYDAETDDGMVTSLKVLEVHDEYVLVDMNHPLAGTSVTMQLDVLAIRPANERDLESVDNARKKAQLSSPEQLMPLNRLLKGHGRR